MRTSLATNRAVKTLLERLMKQNWTITSAFGIGHARTEPMKNLNSDLHPERGALGNTTRRATRRPKNIFIVFEDEASTRGVKILIKNGHIPAKISMPEFTNHNKLAFTHPRSCHES